MIGHHFNIIPFISIDYPLSCDAIDACSDFDIMKRNFTLEQMILHTSDCDYHKGGIYIINNNYYS